MNRFKELKVWQKSVDLTANIYRITEKFPTTEKFGLISQMTRCAVSIPSNIAEGAGRNSKKEFHQFVGISIGSSFELETQLTICGKLNYLSEEQLSALLNELQQVQNMLIGLKKALSKT